KAAFAAAAGALAIAAVMTILFIEQLRQRHLSESREYAAQAAIAMIADAPSALPLAVESAGFAQTPDAERVLADAMSLADTSVLWRAGEELSGVAASPDGALLAAATKHGTIRVFDARTGVVRSTLDHGAEARIVFSPDSKLLASAGGSLRVWDAAS